MRIDPDMAMTYLEFVANRHDMWHQRQLGASQEFWTRDPILQERKFTNVFRILDPGTQYIMTDLREEGISDYDLLMRLFLYRHTGRIEVWEYTQLMLGDLPNIDNLDDVLECWKQYRGTAHVRTRTSDPRSANRKTQTDFKRSVFTSAYLVFPQSQVPGTDKLDSIFDLTKRLFVDGDVPDRFFNRDPEEQFAVLRGNKGVADFMSMQILTDWGYVGETTDREDQFVVPGPGARKGAAALDPTAKAEQVLEWAVDAVRAMPRAPELILDNAYDMPRLPSYMDVQNTLCEFSKYVRFMDKPLTGKPYIPAHPGPQSTPVLPHHW